MKPKVTLYVKSIRISKGKVLTEELYPVKRASASVRFRDALFRAKLKTVYDYILPNGQKAMLSALERLCNKYGLELQVIDVTQENVLYRLMMRLRRIKDFPTLETSQGWRLLPPFSVDEVERFVSRRTTVHDKF